MVTSCVDHVQLLREARLAEIFIVFFHYLSQTLSYIVFFVFLFVVGVEELLGTARTLLVFAFEYIVGVVGDLGDVGLAILA